MAEPFHYDEGGGWRGGFQGGNAEGVTDKFVQGYMPEYFRLAAELGPAARVCELGICGGQSLWLWRKLFPFGQVTGVDFLPPNHYADSKWPDDVRIVIGAMQDPDLPGILGGPFDLIIDDAGHRGDETKAAFENLWPLVRPGGYYVVEDWYVGVFGHHDYRGPSMMEAVQELVSLLGRQESCQDMSPLANRKLKPGADSVLFRYGLAIVKKAAEE